jgi:hypothetical protein
MRELMQRLRQDWREQPVTVSLEVIGTATSMVAAVLLSLELTGLIPVYVFWMMGSVSLMTSSIQRKNMNLMMLMLFYTIMNMIGLWNYAV